MALVKVSAGPENTIDEPKEDEACGIPMRLLDEPVVVAQLVLKAVLQHALHEIDAVEADHAEDTHKGTLLVWRPVNTECLRYN